MGYNPRSKTSGERIGRAQRATEMLELRIKGYTLEEIGRACNVSGARVHKVLTEEIQREMKRRSLAAEELACIELRRLETAYKAIHERIVKGELAAISTGIRISERLAKLYGLDIGDKPAEGRTNTVVLNLTEVIVDREALRNARITGPALDGSAAPEPARLCGG